MCGLSSQTRNRSLLKSMRNMDQLSARTEQPGIPRVNHIPAPLTNGCHRFGSGAAGRAAGANSMPELLAQNPLFQAVAGIEQQPYRDGLVGKHLDAADVARLVVVG